MTHLFPVLRLGLLCALATAAPAETPMSAAAFDAYTRGKTLFYGQSGQPYGAEEYLDNRRVRWSFLDGECKEGRWYEDSGEICFVYDDNPEPQCWLFRQGTGGLIAEFRSGAPQPELYEANDLDQEMLCYGPKIGV